MVGEQQQLGLAERIAMHAIFGITIGADGEHYTQMGHNLQQVREEIMPPTLEVAPRQSLLTEHAGRLLVTVCHAMVHIRPFV